MRYASPMIHYMTLTIVSLGCIYLLACSDKVTKTDCLQIDMQRIGWGSVSAQPDKTCYAMNEQVMLNAHPDAGWRFIGWEGDVVSQSNPSPVNVGRDLHVVARFGLEEYTIETNSVPAGAGQISKNPDSEYYHINDVVTLEAVAGVGYFFDRWTGDTSSTDNVLTLTISGDVSVTANFNGSGPDSVTINGTITWPGHIVSYPVLILFDQNLNIMQAWILDGGNSSIPYTVKFRISDAPATYIFAVDNLDNDGIVFEDGEPWNCYDGDNDLYCDYFVYASGQILIGIDIVLYSGLAKNPLRSPPASNR